MGGDPLTMDYFDNLDNKRLNKYLKILKNRKEFIDFFTYRLIVFQISFIFIIV
jgi:hypothetical protein